MVNDLISWMLGPKGKVARPRNGVSNGKPRTASPSAIPPHSSQRGVSTTQQKEGLHRARQGTKLYKNIDEIGSYESVLTGAEDEFELSPSKRTHIAAVLLSSKGVKRVLILETHENNTTWRLEIKQWLDKHKYSYTMGYTTELVLSQIYEKQQKEKQKTEISEADSSQKAKDFYRLLEKAAAMKANDIHIETREKITVVRFRLNGELIDQDKWSVDYTKQFLNAVYNSNICDEKDASYNPNLNQKAVINYKLSPTVNLRCRLQTLKAYSGGKESNDVILRLLPMGQQTAASSLEKLGYVGDQIQTIERMTRETVGGILVAGVTGSGKSTTLVNLLLTRHKQAAGRKKIITIEDPAEYLIHGATQYSIQREGVSSLETQDPFKSALIDLMRCDPDIIMFGEIRSPDTAKAFEHGVETGHQVMSTVHASSGFEIVSRLSNLGIEDHVFQRKSFLNLMIYQRLLGTVCQHCCLPYDEGQSKLDPVVREQLIEVTNGNYTGIRIRGAGCEKCYQSGIGGMTVCAEVISPDDGLRKLLTKKTLPEAHQMWLDSNAKTHKAIAIEKLRRGIIDPKTIIDTIGNLVG